MWSVRTLLLRKVADLVQPFASALAKNIGRLGAGLGRQQGDIAAIADALLEDLLRVLGVLGDAVLGRSGLSEGAQQRRHILKTLTCDFNLASGDRLHGLHRQLVRLR